MSGDGCITRCWRVCDDIFFFRSLLDFSSFPISSSLKYIWWKEATKNFSAVTRLYARKLFIKLHRDSDREIKTTTTILFSGQSPTSVCGIPTMKVSWDEKRKEIGKAGKLNLVEGEYPESGECARGTKASVQKPSRTLLSLPLRELSQHVFLLMLLDLRLFEHSQQSMTDLPFVQFKHTKH